MAYTIPGVGTFGNQMSGTEYVAQIQKMIEDSQNQELTRQKNAAENLKLGMQNDALKNIYSGIASGRKPQDMLADFIALNPSSADSIIKNLNPSLIPGGGNTTQQDIDDRALFKELIANPEYLQAVKGSSPDVYNRLLTKFPGLDQYDPMSNINVQLRTANKDRAAIKSAEDIAANTGKTQYVPLTNGTIQTILPPYAPGGKIESEGKVKEKIALHQKEQELILSNKYSLENAYAQAKISLNYALQLAHSKQQIDNVNSPEYIYSMNGGTFSKAALDMITERPEIFRDTPGRIWGTDGTSGMFQSNIAVAVSMYAKTITGAQMSNQERMYLIASFEPKLGNTPELAKAKVASLNLLFKYNQELLEETTPEGKRRVAAKMRAEHAKAMEIVTKQIKSHKIDDETSKRYYDVLNSASSQSEKKLSGNSNGSSPSTNSNNASDDELM